MYGYIYKRECLVNGKIYVGKHKYTGPGLDESYRGSGILLQRALEKYGEENFTLELVCYAESADMLNILEKFYILEFNSLVPSGYNIAMGGEGGDCVTCLPDELYHIRSKKISESLKGHAVDDATRDKISSKLTNWYKDESNREQRRKETLALFQKSEHRVKQKEGLHQYWSQPEERQRRHQQLIEQTHKNWSTPEYIEKQHATRATEAYKQKMTESLKGKTAGYITINNGEQQKRVPPQTLQDWINSGWRIGGKPRTAEQIKRYKDAALKRCYKPNGKSVKCLETGIVYNSIKECVQATGISEDSVRRSFKNGCSVVGLTFVLMEGE